MWPGKTSSRLTHSPAKKLNAWCINWQPADGYEPARSARWLDALRFCNSRFLPGLSPLTYNKNSSACHEHDALDERGFLEPCACGVEANAHGARDSVCLLRHLALHLAMAVRSPARLAAALGLDRCQPLRASRQPARAWPYLGRAARLRPGYS